MTKAKPRLPGPSLFARSRARQLAMSPPCCMTPGHLCLSWLILERMLDRSPGLFFLGSIGSGRLPGALGYEGKLGQCEKGVLCIFLRNFAFIPWAYRETTSILKMIWLTLCFGSLTSGWQKILEEPEGEIPEQRNRQASCGRSWETLYVRSCLRLHRSTCCLWQSYGFCTTHQMILGSRTLPTFPPSTFPSLTPSTWSSSSGRYHHQAHP